MPKQVRTRFAPSPTGFLHIGGVRTALFNYLFAKQNNGQFILRLEDTDRERFIPEGVEQIIESLNWLELSPDETHQQSERHQELDVYQKYANKLLSLGLAYYSPTTPGELDKLREKSKKAKTAFLYKKSDDTKNTSEILEGTPLRLDAATTIKKLGLEKTIAWEEPTGRSLDWQTNLIDDFILIKSDGYPTYNFANVVDDHEMRISHVLRGDEFIASTPKHILLYRALGLSEPVFVHLPVINGPDGKKLSKRTGDTNVLDYRDKGYLREALLNFLALLGWNDGSQQEIFSSDELIKKFKLDRINTSPAVFDPNRLNWMNGKYIREILPLSELSQRVNSFWPKQAKNANPETKHKVLEVVRDRLEYFEQLPALCHFFFELPPPSPKAVNEVSALFKTEASSPQDWLNTVIQNLNKTALGREKLELTLRELVKKVGSPKALFGSLRIALTEEDNTPPIWDIIYALGKEESVRRLEAMRDKL